MGQSVSQEEINARAAELLSKFSDKFCNVGIDESLQRYSGTDSAAKLEEYSSQLLTELGRTVPAYVQNLGFALVSASPVPNAVGLGAFVISLILQIAFIAVKGHQSQGPSPMDLLRRVFAEEKASEVRDLMEEYLKRSRMYLRDDYLLLVNTIRLEEQLSAQLTRLKNSMLHDGHMNSRALKRWTNGAAFHALMLIQVARLKKKQGSGLESAKAATVSAINDYNKDLSNLLEKYKAYKISSLYSKTIYRPGIHTADTNCYVTDGDSGEEVKFSNLKFCDISSQDYINYMIPRDKQIIELKNYFYDLKNNVEVLIDQQATFKIPESRV